MKTRILVSIPLLALMATMIYVRTLPFYIIIVAFMILSQYEVFMAMRNASFKPCVWTCFAFALLLYPTHIFFGFNGVFYLFTILNIINLVWAIFLPNRQFIDIMVSMFVMFYPAIPLYFLILIGDMESVELSRIAMAMALIIPVASDTAAYFIGKFFGKHKLSPMISPNKTVEGAIGGFILCQLVIIPVYIIAFNLNVIQGVRIIPLIICSAICGIFAQLGDLIASAVKRYSGIKDFGHIFPGHGGILDRIDSIIFCAVAVYTYFKIFAP